MEKSAESMQAEFGKGAAKILGVMLNPFVSKKKKRETLCKFVEGLSEDTFNAYPLQVIEVINKKEKVCKEYTDSEAQVDGILEWLPRMKNHRELLVAVIREHRIKYRLKE